MIAASRLPGSGRGAGVECAKSRPEGRPQGPVAPARRGRRRRHRSGPGRIASVQVSNWARFCAVVARATHYAQIQGTASSIRQAGDLGADRDPRLFLGRARRARCPRARRTDPDRPACGPSGVARCLGRSGDRPSSLNPAQYSKSAYQLLPRLRRQTGFARRKPPGDQTAGYACERHSVIRRCARSKFTPNPITGRSPCA